MPPGATMEMATHETVVLFVWLLDMGAGMERPWLCGPNIRMRTDGLRPGRGMTIH